MPGEIEALREAVRDPSVIELMINEDGSVYTEKGGGLMQKLPFNLEAELILAFLTGIVGDSEELGPKRPYADLSAVDGSRVHVICPPLTRRGICVTIRKRPAHRPSLEEIIGYGSLTPDCAGFLKFCVAQRRSMLFVGSASCGKTTLMNALASLAPASERILVLEDSPELVLPQRHVIYLKTRLRDPHGAQDVGLRDLVVNALRMRPDRILIGEVRSIEAADMIQAMNVGNDGVMATIHANGAREALQRIETLMLMTGIDLPLKVARANMAQGLDVIVFMVRLADGSRRVAQVAEVTGMEGETITMADLFKMESRKSAKGLSYELKATGAIPRFYDALRYAGQEPPLEFFKH